MPWVFTRFHPDFVPVSGLAPAIMLRSAGSIRHAQSGMRNPNKTTNREEGSRCASRRSQSCFSSACPHPPRRRRTPAENFAIGSRAFGFLTFQTVQYAAQSPTAAWLLPDGMIGHGTMKPRSFATYSPMRCKNSSRYENDKATYQAARGIWIQNWVARFGDAAVAWIEIPDERVNHVDNPTGHSVLCFSTFHSAYNGVFCFVPFEAAANDLTGRPTTFG